MKRLAIVTQSYKGDFKECGLLCKSIDLFVPKEIPHYIFVNDEDFKLFQIYNYGQHRILKKSTILPMWLVRFPVKILGHYFHISPFTLPVRGWIIQQICKLGVFEVIDSTIDAVLNIDSETVFIRPFDYNSIVKEDKYLMFRDIIKNQPSHSEYCVAAKKLFLRNENLSSFNQYDYMNVPVCFERENLNSLLNAIASNNLFKSWKMALCNTYRFGEYYLYGIYVQHLMNGKSHFLVDKYLFPQIDVSEYNNKELFIDKVNDMIEDKAIMGFWLQKKNRKNLSSTYLDFNLIEEIFEKTWNTINIK